MLRNKRFPSFVLAAALALSLTILTLARWQHERSAQATVAQTAAQSSSSQLRLAAAQSAPRVVAATTTTVATDGAQADKHAATHTSTARASVARAEHTAVRQDGDKAEEASELAREERREGEDNDEQPIMVNRNGRQLQVNADHDLLRFDQPGEAMSDYVKKRLPTGATELPVDRYFDALEKVKQMKQYSTASQRLAPSEAELAAAASKNRTDDVKPEMAGGNAAGVLGTWTNLGPGNVGGRTRSLVIDPTDANIMYAGAVDGGIWKTTNGGTSWSPLDDFLPNIAVTTMVMDPSNHNTIYAGTGEGYFNSDAVRGAGIFRTTDAGAHWTRLPSTNNSNFFFVQKVAVSPTNGQHLYAATQTGVQRSLNGGASWTQVLASNAANGANGAMDLAMRTDQATDYIFATVGTFAQSHIWRNTDAGGSGTWTDVYTEATMERTSLAIAPSNQSVIYAMAASTTGTLVNGRNYQDGLLAVFRSTSNGDAGTWTTQVRNNSANKQDTLLLSNPVNGVLTECGFGTSQMINQGWYHNQLAVDPTDSNKVWAAGTDVWRSDNGGTNWGVASYWWFQGNGTPPANGDPQLVHADNHIIVFAPGYNGTTNQKMLVGDDGGIYKTDNAHDGNVGYATGTTPSGGTVTSTSPICANNPDPVTGYTFPNPVIWGPLNNNYQVSQFNQGLPYPDGASYFGGTQDNGTNRGTDAGGPNGWSRILGGDGGYVGVNPTNTQILYAENTGLSFKRSNDGGGSFVAKTSGISGDVFPFYTFFRMDPSVPTRLWLGGRFMWRTDNNGDTWVRTSNAQQTGGSITAMAIAPTNSDAVIDGAASGQLRRTTTGTTLTSTSVLNTVWLQSFTPRGNGNGTISWLEYDPQSASNVWCTISNFNGVANANGTSAGHVFKSADGGGTWTLADGTQTASNPNAIPDIPTHSVTVDPTNSQRIYVGTDLGVFVTLDGGANWYKEVTGFSNVQTQSLSTLTNGGVTSLYAFTYGRGAYKVAISKSCSTVAPNTTQNFPAEGGTGTLTVTSTCDWTATNDSGFIAVNSAPTGTGNGSVTYTVAPNASAASRSGTIVVAGTVVNITQDSASANSIVGQITNGASNAGVNGATVTLSGASNAVTTTNAAGGYSFTGLTPGAGYTVTASGNGLTYTPASKSVASLSGIAVENFVGASGAVSVPMPQGSLVISEFRLRGPSGANDEFVEIFNFAGSAVTVATTDNSLGWAVAASDGAPRFIIPKGLTIPARGHFLAANNGASGYSLSNYGGTGAAAPDITYNMDIPDDSGLTLYSTSDPTNFTEAYRLDSVGFAGDASVAAREGVGLAPLGAATPPEYSYVRRLNNGSPRDTSDNTQDFVLVSTTGGVINGVQSQLGGPGPENLASVVQRNATIKASYVDAACGASNDPSTACARVRVFTPDSTEPSNSTAGTLKIRRRFTNNTGGTVSRLRFRIVDITTLNSPGYSAGGGQADLRVLSSAGGTVTNTLTLPVTLTGTTRESPPAYTLGGGLNTSLSVALGGGLSPGNSIDIEFNLGVMQPGSFRFFINIESDTSNPAAPVNTLSKSNNATINASAIPTVTVLPINKSAAPHPKKQ
ncbi:MAG: hypothetical protein QOE33_901 [Acidobacteriota bacterium]|nr:hypothetical protein [Acidobacteriota bacterium]